MSLVCRRLSLPKLLACFKLNPIAFKLKHTKTLPLFASAQKYGDKTALYDHTGSHTFENIFVNAQIKSTTFSGLLGGKTSERVLFLCGNNVDYVIVLWAIWMSGQIAVPLSPQHPESILDYYAKDTNSKLLVTTPEHAEVMERLSKVTKASLYVIDTALTRQNKLENSTKVLPLQFYENNNALILYTSGTTGNPKGVVLSHKNLLFQTTCLLNAWKWSSDDVILHTLPLHHVHGTVNALFCPLAIGATTVMLPKFSAEEVWSYLLGPNEKNNKKVSVFMAVPTIYSKLIDEYKNKLEDQKEHIRQYLSTNVRLMVSGSAPLPVPLYEKWLQISGHNLLERYGMTEIGMCLSNEYDSDRSPGYVGVPLPGISIRLAEPSNDSYKTLLECSNNEGTIVFDREVDENIKGELLVKGDAVFKEYFNKPDATKKEFTEDGWFKTGDMCEYSLSKKRFRMLGRTSVDIIKSGGYKLSALQIETKLLAHPDIKECAVVGIGDDVWGERVAAVVVLHKGAALELENLRSWAADKMPKYSLPTVMRTVEEIPKNAMGKVNKKDLVRSIFKS